MRPEDKSAISACIFGFLAIVTAYVGAHGSWFLWLLPVVLVGLVVSCYFCEKDDEDREEVDHEPERE